MEWTITSEKTEREVDVNPAVWVRAAEKSLKTRDFIKAMDEIERAVQYSNGDIHYQYEKLKVWYIVKPEHEAQSFLFSNIERFKPYLVQNPEKLLKILGWGANRDKLVDIIQEAVLMSASVNNWHIVENLIKNINSNNRIRMVGEKIIFSAINAGENTIVLMLLDTEINVNMGDEVQRSLLMYASFVGMLPAIAMLLGRGANINAKSQRGETPLMAAVNGGQVQALELLLSNGARINEEWFEGKTALFKAIRKRNREIAELLIKKGALVNARNSYGDTPILVAIQNGLTGMAEMLLARKANCNMKNESGICPVLEAANREEVEILRILLRNGANVNSQDKMGNTSLINVASRKHWKYSSELIWELLLEYNADVNIRNMNGETALLCALDHEWLFTDEIKMAKVLVERHGASVAVTSEQGRTVFSIAEEYGHSKSTVAWLASMQ